MINTKFFNFKIYATLIAVATGLVAGSMGVLGWRAQEQLRAVDAQWIEYSSRALEANRLLGHVNYEFGYGGMIHNFKNYILHQDPVLLREIKQHRKHVRKEIYDVKAYVTNDEERQLFAIILGTFEEYMKKLEVAEENFQRGLSSREVDKLVAVNDKLALMALKGLEEIFTSRTTLAHKKTQEALNSVSSTISALFFLVPVALLLGMSLVMFLSRITRANLATIELHQELSSVLASAPDAIFSVLDDGLIIRANESSEQMFGYSNDKLLGMNIEQLIPEKMRHGHQDFVKRRFASLSPRPFSASKGLFGLSSDGREFPAEISISFVTKDDRRTAVVIIRDITERHKAEVALNNAHNELHKRVEQRTEVLLKTNEELAEQIKQRKLVEDQLIEASKMAAVGEMTSGIAHDLSQPMNIIRMNVEAELLKMSRGKGDLESTKEILSRVEAQIIRMSEIVDRMRTFSDDEAESVAKATDLGREHQQSESEPRSGAKSNSNSGRIKILVVDDEEDAANSLSDFLQDMDYLVYTAHNGQEALSIYDSDPTDVVITDIRMPVMDGIELIRRLRERSTEVPIIAMTGHSPMGAEADIDYGTATEVWKKPLSLTEVNERLTVYCGSSTQAKPMT